MRVSTSTKASMLACGSCRPRIHTTSVRDGSTVSGQPPRPEEPEQPKMGLFQTPAKALALERVLADALVLPGAVPGELTGFFESAGHSVGHEIPPLRWLIARPASARGR